MKKSISIAAVVVLLIVAGYWGFRYAEPAITKTALAESLPTESTNSDSSIAFATATTSSLVASTGKQLPMAQTSTPPTVTVAATASATIPVNVQDRDHKVLPPLTRALELPKTVQINERSWAVLGTRDVQQGNTMQTVLVLRDEISGQLDYRRSALRFVLQPGTDYEAFIRERRNAQRLFVNVLHGEVGVDAAYIADEYTALAGDKRVVNVQFLPLVARPKLR